VTPTLSPAEADSETELAAASPSLTAETSNSLLSVTAMSKLCVELEPSSEVAVTSICIDCADSKSRPLRIGDGDLAGLGIDREGVVRVLAQRVGDAVRRAVVVAGKGGHADAVTGFGVLCHRVGGRIAIADRGNIELVAVGDGDIEALRGARAVLGGRGDFDLHRLRGLEVQAVGSATVTSPVSASIAKASFGFSLSE
jgi:hypothetical protein